MLGRLQQLKTWQLIGLVFIGLLAIFAAFGKLGILGTDNDDVMRLVQVRDLLAGQGWYDHMQYRMGEAGGTLMHWSRVIDLPIAALIFIFDIFLPRQTAEAIAISVWPVMTGLGLIIGVRLLQRDETREALKPYILSFGLLITVLLLITFYMFAPGRIDHHNVQLVAIALAFIGLSDPAHKPARFALAGAMTGLSLVIGTEALPLLAVNCGFAALLWAYKGADAAKSIRAFSLAFAAIICAGFLIDTPPSAYGQIYCDVLAINYLALALCGSLGLAALTFISGLSRPARRFIGLAVLGGISAALLILISPQCLTNPLGALPENAQLFWLDHVEEAQPLLSSRGLENGAFLYFAGFAIFALLMSAWRYKARGFTPARIYALVFLSLIIGMVFYQLRYFPFGLVIASFMLMPWAAETFVDGKAKSKESVAYIFALALSCASLWIFPATLLGGEDEAAANAELTNGAAAPNRALSDAGGETQETDLCFPSGLETYLKTRSAATILAEPNLSSPLLQFTHHRGLNGNYHRNGRGIDMAIKMFLQSPERAAAAMRGQSIEYVIYCAERSAYKIYAGAAKDGLAAHMIDGALPAPFVKIKAASDDTAMLWHLPSNSAQP